MFRKMHTDIKALATTPLFRNLPRRELGALVRIGTVVELGPRRLVSRPGEYPAQFVVVVRGRVVATTAQGPRRVLREGNWLGTVDECGTGATEPETYRTVVTTTLYVLSARELGALQAACPRFAARLSGLTDRPPKVERVAGAWVGAVRVWPGGAATTGRATLHCLRSAVPALYGVHEQSVWQSVWPTTPEWARARWATDGPHHDESSPDRSTPDRSSPDRSSTDSRITDSRITDSGDTDGWATDGATEGSEAEWRECDERLVRPARRSYS